MEETLEKKSFLKKYFGDKAFYKMVLSVALPIMLQNGITNFVNLLDNIMVGQVGTEQMSGVAISNQLFFIFMLAIFGLCSGAGIFTAQFHGQNDDEGIRQTFRFKFIATLTLTVIFGLLYCFLADELIGLYLNEGSATGDLEATLGYAKDYLFILFIGFIPYAITQVYSSTLREVESAVLPMVAGFVAVVFNCIGNYILIFGKLGLPVLGVKGAAISTVISRYVELIIVVTATHIKKDKYTFVKGIYRHFFTIGKGLIKDIVKRGMPLFINELLWSIGMSILAGAYSVRGLSVVAAYNISSTIYNLFAIVYMALGNAVGIIIGKYLGQGDFDKAVDYDRKMIMFAVLCGIFFAILMGSLSPLFPKIYNTSDEVKQIATYLLLVTSCKMILDSFMHSCYFTLRSGGKTIVTFIFDSGYVMGIAVPMALIMVHCTSLPIIPIYIIVCSCDIIKCIIGLIFLKKKSWLNKLV